MSDVLPISPKSHKYNKITQQKKFHLLTLIYKEGIPIRQAAQIVGINYLTAKTIIFFHKNKCKSYQFEINKSQPHPHHQELTAAYSTIRKNADINEKLIKPKSRIEVICSIGNVLSPPHSSHENSPTNCSNCLDNSIKPLPLTLEPSPDQLGSFPTHIAGQDFTLMDLRCLLFMNETLNKQILGPQQALPSYKTC